MIDVRVQKDLHPAKLFVCAYVCMCVRVQIYVCVCVCVCLSLDGRVCVPYV